MKRYIRSNISDRIRHGTLDYDPDIDGYYAEEGDKYVQFQDRETRSTSYRAEKDKWGNDQITKKLDRQPRTSSKTWGRAWQDGKLVKSFEGPKYKVRQDMARYLDEDSSITSASNIYLGKYTLSDIEDAAQLAQERYEDIRDYKYKSIYQDLIDAIDDINEGYDEDEIYVSALSSRFLAFCKTGEDAGNHFTVSEDSIDELAPYGGKLYVSSISGAFGESIGNGKLFDSIPEAITYWFKQSKKYPTCTSIDGTAEQARAVRQWVLDNEDAFRELAAKYNCPYKLDWMISVCAKPVRDYKYVDQISPFSIG